MHGDLEAFLRRVWREVTDAPGGVLAKIAADNAVLERHHRRRTIDSPEHQGPGTAERLRAKVYEIYNRVEGPAPAGLSAEAAPGWLREAHAIGRGLTMRLQVGAQTRDFDENYTLYQAGRASEDVTAALLRGFIHYLNRDGGGGAATTRVYINPRPEHAIQLLAYLIERLTSEPEIQVGGPRQSSPLMDAAEREDGGGEETLALARRFSSCKIAGPLSLGKRSDGILVYTPNREVAEAVVVVLKGADRGWFAPGTPRLTEASDLDGVGVSLAEEPPQIAVGIRNTPQQSFGSLRSELIAAALLDSVFNERTAYTGRDFGLFCGAVETAFRGYGLDPNAPAWNA